MCCTSSRRKNPTGVIVQFGGQTPLNLARRWPPRASHHGYPAGKHRPGRRPRRVSGHAEKAGLMQPDNGTAHSIDEAMAMADTIGYPVIVRPSFVLGGRAMKIVYDPKDLENFTRLAILASPGHPGAHRQVSGRRRGSGCGRHQRRAGHHHRRHHGAHRGGRGSFRATAPVSCRPTASQACMDETDHRCHQSHGPPN
jgi:hypothetical protein